MIRKIASGINISDVITENMEAFMRTILTVGCSHDWPNYLKSEEFQEWNINQSRIPVIDLSNSEEQEVTNDDENATANEGDKAIENEEENVESNNDDDDDGKPIADDLEAKDTNEDATEQAETEETEESNAAYLADNKPVSAMEMTWKLSQH